MKTFVVVLVLVVVGWAIFYYKDALLSSTAINTDPQISMLTRAGDECVAISEKATAHIIPTLEFQRMELIGRKANVMMRCMADRHFYQNPAWLKYAEPIAKKNAKVQHISDNEALENLKRSDMLFFEPVQSKPIYWKYVKSPAT